ncbi:MAG: CHASE2 domain-containing protein [Sandaracinobacteroides sp.]
MSSRRIDRVSIVLNWAAAFVLGFVLTLLDPFGLSEGADRLSERTVLGAFAPFLSGPDAPRAGQTRITVVIVDDAFLQRYRLAVEPDATWPISRADQTAYLFEPILEHLPRALFIDWVFHAQEVSKGDRASALAESLNELVRFDPRLASRRILLADRPPRAEEDRRTGCPHRLTNAELLKTGSHSSPELRDLWTKPWAERVAVRHWGREERYPLAPLAVRPDGAALERAPGSDCAPFPAREPGSNEPTLLVPSAALALFSAWCESNDPLAADHSLCPPLRLKSPLRRQKVEGYVLHSFPDHLADTMSLPSAPQWLWYQSPLMREIVRTARQTGPGALAGREQCDRNNRMGPWRALREGLRLRLGSPDESVPFNPCIAIDTISATDLQSLGDGLSDEALHALFHNRLVLVGADLDAAPDRAGSPVNGTIPAVLVHATVLENLISDGAGRSREPPMLWRGITGGDLGNMLMAALAGIPFGLLMSAVAQKLPKPPGRADRMLWISLLLVLAGALLLSAALIWPDQPRGLRPVIGVTGLALVGLGARHRGIRNLLLAFGVLAVGLVLPLLGGIALYQFTNWAPANWGAATLWKLALPGGATAALVFAFGRPDDWLHSRWRSTQDKIRHSPVCNWLLAALMFVIVLALLLLAVAL